MSIADKLTTIAENIPKVYQAGYDKGVAEGGGGGDSWYDTFWDNFQQNGERYDYENGFYGRGWNDENFNPKYPIKGSFMPGIFQKTNITKRIEADFSQASECKSAFRQSLVTEVGTIDLKKASKATLDYFFLGCEHLRKIEKIVIYRSDYTMNLTFDTCKALEELVIEGEIKNNGWNFEGSPLLTRGSITNIINVLADASTGTSGLTIKFSLTAVNNAFETAEGLADGSTSAEWLALVATKPNWTISLA